MIPNLQDFIDHFKAAELQKKAKLEKFRKEHPIRYHLKHAGEFLFGLCGIALLLFIFIFLPCYGVYALIAL